VSATDELRRMLDERGVEWDYGITGAATTRFSANGIDLTFTPMRDGLVCSTILTPEQAIAATVGHGTCHDKNGFDPEIGFECTVCGAMVDCYMVTPVDTGHEVQLKFCPNCGRRVDA